MTTPETLPLGPDTLIQASVDYALTVERADAPVAKIAATACQHIADHLLRHPSVRLTFDGMAVIDRLPEQRTRYFDTNRLQKALQRITPVRRAIEPIDIRDALECADRALEFLLDLPAQGQLPAPPFSISADAQPLLRALHAICDQTTAALAILNAVPEAIGQPTDQPITEPTP